MDRSEQAVGAADSTYRPSRPAEAAVPSTQASARIRCQPVWCHPGLWVIWRASSRLQINRKPGLAHSLQVREQVGDLGGGAVFEEDVVPFASPVEAFVA